MKRAYLDLETEGVIVTRHGRGSCVADAQDRAQATQLAELDGHLAAGRIAATLGLTDETLMDRLHKTLHPEEGEA